MRYKVKYLEGESLPWKVGISIPVPYLIEGHWKFVTKFRPIEHCWSLPRAMDTALYLTKIYNRRNAESNASYQKYGS